VLNAVPQIFFEEQSRRFVQIRHQRFGLATSLLNWTRRLRRGIFSASRPPAFWVRHVTKHSYPIYPKQLFDLGTSLLNSTRRLRRGMRDSIPAPPRLAFTRHLTQHHILHSAPLSAIFAISSTLHHYRLFSRYPSLRSKSAMSMPARPVSTLETSCSTSKSAISV
jgi:hypothetical protein